MAIAIDVQKSLATGMAVTIASPFITDNGFSFAGDPTGVAESTNLYVFGAQSFNTAQSPLRQAGVMTITNLNSSTPRTTGSTVLPVPTDPQGTTPFINFGNTPGPLTGQGPAIGGIENLLGIDEGVNNGVNFIRLYAPGTLTSEGSLNLQDPDKLVALSETFHPELSGSALIDVQGNVSAFNANSASGMVLNDQGNLDLVQIGTTSNSEIIGEPLSHVQMPRRIGTVTLVTTSRSVNTRNGVLIVPSLRTLGTLSLPS
jgi:hypothetical protein